jgi:hypothetical protein
VSPLSRCRCRGSGFGRAARGRPRASHAPLTRGAGPAPRLAHASPHEDARHASTPAAPRPRAARARRGIARRCPGEAAPLRKFYLGIPQVLRQRGATRTAAVAAPLPSLPTRGRGVTPGRAAAGGSLGRGAGARLRAAASARPRAPPAPLRLAEGRRAPRRRVKQLRHRTRRPPHRPPPRSRPTTHPSRAARRLRRAAPARAPGGVAQRAHLREGRGVSD